MKILLIAATVAEITPLIIYMESRWQRQNDHVFTNEGKEVEICITGIGMVAATYGITKALANRSFDIAIQAGIAGSFDREIELGTVVWIADDRYGDLGAEDHDNHIDIFEMGFLNKDVFPFTDGKLLTPETVFHATTDLQKVSGLTVNMVSGNEKTIERLAKRYGSTIESMEGAAFHYVCLCENQSFMQVRSISNYIEPRDRSKWKIKEAVAELNDWLIYTFENTNDI